MLDEIKDAIAAGDIALAEELVNSITDPYMLYRLSDRFASDCQHVWAGEISNRGDALKRGLKPLLFRFFGEGEQPS